MWTIKQKDLEFRPKSGRSLLFTFHWSEINYITPSKCEGAGKYGLVIYPGRREHRFSKYLVVSVAQRSCDL